MSCNAEHLRGEDGRSYSGATGPGGRLTRRLAGRRRPRSYSPAHQLSQNRQRELTHSLRARHSVPNVSNRRLETS